MKRANPKAAVVWIGIFLAVGTGAIAQTGSGSSGSSDPATQSPSKQKQPKGDAPPANSNSFPEDESRQAAAEKAAEKKKAEQSPAAEDGQSSTPPSAAAGKSAPAADENAFPEDVSKKAADEAKSSGSSSSSDYDQRVTGGGRNSVKTDVPLPHMNTKDPLKEDLNVGGYYLSSGDYIAAYQRFKEASKLAPENTDAMFGLAEAARHLKKRDEALANYQLFLQIVDSGSKAKDARKAIASLAKDR